MTTIFIHEKQHDHVMFPKKKKKKEKTPEC
jgi:hypothetical protein